MSKRSILAVEEAGETKQNDQIEDLKEELAMLLCEHLPGRSLNFKKWKRTSLSTAVVLKAVLHFFCTEFGH